MPILRRTSLQSAESVLSEDEIQESFWPSPVDVLNKRFLRHVSGIRYAEVCAGNGKLIRHLQKHAYCMWASDIFPRHESVQQRDALSLTLQDLSCANVVITNPPFNAKFLYPLIDHLLSIGIESWLFLPSDFAFRYTAAYVMPFCARIVAVGQVRFIEDSPSKGETNFAWFHFVPYRTRTIFEGMEMRYNSKRVPDRLKQRARSL